jgi:uncharacterized protein (DUF427 family)
MFGSGPFGFAPSGSFNQVLPRERLLYVEPSARWIRGELAGETVVDSRRAVLLHEHGHLPCYYFPRSDVALHLLAPGSGRREDAVKGPTELFTLQVAGEVRQDSAWSHQQPPDGAQALAGLIAVSWVALDRWYEESDLVGGTHPRDPYHRVDALATARRVRIELGGQVLAETERAIGLFETALPTRWYLPAGDVRRRRLEPIALTTECAYKGVARYWSVRVGDSLQYALVWSYEQPRAEASSLAGALAFFDERVDTFLDGELQERPRTPWASDQWARALGPD